MHLTSKIRTQYQMIPKELLVNIFVVTITSIFLISSDKAFLVIRTRLLHLTSFSLYAIDEAGLPIYYQTPTSIITLSYLKTSTS